MPSATLAKPWRNLLLTVHVASAVSVLGGDLVLLALGVAGFGGADPLTVYPAASLIASWVVAPLAVLALATGLLLGMTTGWGLFWYWWVTIKLAMTTVLTAVLLLVLVPRLGVMAEMVAGPAARPLASAERLPLLAAPALASTLLAVAVVLAIFKPGWRLRSGTSRPSP